MRIVYDDALTAEYKSAIEQKILNALSRLGSYLARNALDDQHLGTLGIGIDVHPALFDFIPDGLADPAANRVTLWAMPENVSIVHEIAHILFPAKKRFMSEGIAVFLEEIVSPQELSAWGGVTHSTACRLHAHYCGWTRETDWAEFIARDENFDDVRLSRSVFARALSACLVNELVRKIGLRQVLTAPDQVGGRDIEAGISRVRLDCEGSLPERERFEEYFKRKMETYERYEPFYALGIPRSGNPCEHFQGTGERIGKANADRLWAVFMDDMRAMEDARKE